MFVSNHTWDLLRLPLQTLQGLKRHEVKTERCSSPCSAEESDWWINTCRFSPSAAPFSLHCPRWSPGSARFSPPRLHRAKFSTFKHTNTHGLLKVPALSILNLSPARLGRRSHSAGKQHSSAEAFLNRLQLVLKQRSWLLWEDVELRSTAG